MPTDYKKVYRGAKQALGAPTKAFVKFFDALAEPGLRVLDVGCDQGRDALFIARLGHSVVGIDLSPTGIRELLLIDRTLHMLEVRPHYVPRIRSAVS